MSAPLLVFAMPGNEAMAEALATKLEVKVGGLEIRRFPDGESYVRLDSPVEGAQVFIVCTLDRPDEKILPLLFLAGTAKELGAVKVGLVAPYLAYMRQDKRFRPGEAITSVHFARLISASFDWMVTVDPHLHRRSGLSEIYSIPTSVLHAAAPVARWVHDHVEKPLLVGPDEESAQWVAEVAEAARAPYVVLKKTRYGDYDVKIDVPDLESYPDRTPVLVDDIISTGRTMTEAAARLCRSGARPPVCVGVHAVFAGSAYEDLKAAGAARIVTCSTIPHPTNEIDLTDLLLAGSTKKA